MLVNEMLIDMRKRAGLTQKQIAEKLFVSRTTYAQYETGKRAVSAEMFFDIMKVLEEDFSFTSRTNDFFNFIKEGRLEDVKRFAEQGMNLEILNSEGYRPFLYACIFNQGEKLEYSIEKGSPYLSDSDLHWQECNGQDKLFYSLERAHLEVSRVLMASNFDIGHEINFVEDKGLVFLPSVSRIFIQFEKYGQNIPISKIKEFATKIISVDKEKLINEHISIAESLVKKYKGNNIYSYLTDDELEKASIEGLKKAANRYNPDIFHSFKTYCVWWIKQRIFKTNAEKTGLPTHLFDYYIRFKRTYEEKLRETGEKPSKEEIAQLFETNLKLLNKIEEKFLGTVFWQR